MDDTTRDDEGGKERKGPPTRLDTLTDALRMLEAKLHEATEEDCERWDMEAERVIDDMAEHKRRFLLAYLRTGKAIPSAIEAGAASKRVATVHSSRLLQDPEVLAALNLKRKVYSFRAQVKAMDLIAELKKLALGDFSEIEFNERGKPVRTPENEHLWSCVRPKEVVKRKYADRTETSVKVSIGSQLEAIRALMGYMGLNDGAGSDEKQAPGTVIVVGVDADAVIGKRLLDSSSTPRLIDGSAQPPPLPGPADE